MAAKQNKRLAPRPSVQDSSPVFWSRTGFNELGTRMLNLFKQLLGGFGTSLLAALALLWSLFVLITSAIGIGLLLVPGAIRALHAVADLERSRLGKWGASIVESTPGPTRLGSAIRDTAVRREFGWLAIHATRGMLVGLVGISLPLFAIQNITFPLWWASVPQGEASTALWFWVVDSWTGALLVALSAVGWLVLTIVLSPWLASLQASTGRRLLPPPAGTDLPLRIATLTATRAAALDAHATELRRIERSLHDGTQNPLVAATMLIGAARRKLPTDTHGADELLDQAQTAVEGALGQLRDIVRGILPPVLADRGLSGAIAGLAATSGVPTSVEITPGVRCPASVEASAYFMIAEALTNISRHSDAHQASVVVQLVDDHLDVQVSDDGRGGADELSGSGLAGIRQRIEAHDGTLIVTSPPGGPTTLHARLPCGL